ncbi:MAG: hypothetical protein ABR915_04475 [Thermoguttaceae bacterium]
MLRRAVLVALVVGLVALVLPRAASADEPPIIGVVRAAAAGAEEAATVKVGQVIYKVTKDDNGRKVARGANDKKVEIKGILSNRNDAKWITVTSCKIVE